MFKIIWKNKKQQNKKKRKNTQSQNKENIKQHSNMTKCIFTSFNIHIPKSYLNVASQNKKPQLENESVLSIVLLLFPVLVTCFFFSLLSPSKVWLCFPGWPNRKWVQCVALPAQKHRQEGARGAHPRPAWRPSPSWEEARRLFWAD